MADTLTLPETTEYRVVGVGATYYKPTEQIGDDGQYVVRHVHALGARGEIIELTEREARRLEGLGAVVAKDAPKSYDELSDDELQAATSQRGLAVRGTAADGTVRREDSINALLNADAGEAHGAGTQPGGIADTKGNVNEVYGGPADEQVREFADKIKSEKLNASDTVALAGDDPEKARAVLAAESIATSGQPRAGVESKLTAIADGE